MGKITNAVKNFFVVLTEPGEDYNDPEIDKAVKDIEGNETKGRRIGLEMEMKETAEKNNYNIKNRYKTNTNTNAKNIRNTNENSKEKGKDDEEKVL